MFLKPQICTWHGKKADKMHPQFGLTLARCTVFHSSTINLTLSRSPVRSLFLFIHFPLIHWFCMQSISQLFATAISKFCTDKSVLFVCVWACFTPISTFPYHVCIGSNLLSLQLLLWYRAYVGCCLFLHSVFSVLMECNRKTINETKCTRDYSRYHQYRPLSTWNNVHIYMDNGYIHGCTNKPKKIWLLVATFVIVCGFSL